MDKGVRHLPDIGLSDGLPIWGHPGFPWVMVLAGHSCRPPQWKKMAVLEGPRAKGSGWRMIDQASRGSSGMDAAPDIRTIAGGRHPEASDLAKGLQVTATCELRPSFLAPSLPALRAPKGAALEHPPHPPSGTQQRHVVAVRGVAVTPGPRA